MRYNTLTDGIERNPSQNKNQSEQSEEAEELANIKLATDTTNSGAQRSQQYGNEAAPRGGCGQKTRAREKT